MLPTAARPRDSSPLQTQANLLRGRGDFVRTTHLFNVSLPRPAPGVRPTVQGDPVSRLGMALRRAGEVEGRASITASPSLPKLHVTGIDERPHHPTPVAEWNVHENRQADRGEHEHHASLAIQAGDRICQVNGTHGDDEAMLAELHAAADLISPKAVNLTLERVRSDIFAPFTCGRPPTAPTAPSKRDSDSVESASSPASRQSSFSEHFEALGQPACKRDTQMPPKLPDDFPSVKRGRRGGTADQSRTASPSIAITSYSPSPASSRSSSITRPLRSTRARLELARTGLFTLAR